jgi:protein-L-isoaspartate(D-aspartate) O-methyltransferase
MDMRYKHKRDELANLLFLKGIKHPAVLKAVATVPRHLLVPDNLREYAYEDEALPIGFGQTISQPYVVAKMTEALLQEKEKLDKVLEIGTGSGYQAAILSQVANEVYTVERIKGLLDAAETTLKQLNYKNIKTLYDDGNLGWPDNAPYEAIIVTAATYAIPEVLLAQLDVGGRLIIPIDTVYGAQQLQLIMYDESGYHTHYLDPVMFVRFAQWKDVGVLNS